MASQFFTLSLFIMLLAFFVILNSMSSYEESKTQPVMNSLTLAFASRETPENLEIPITPMAIEGEQKGDALDHLRDAFRSRMSDAQIRKNRLGTMMHVRVPLAHFERELSRSGDAQGTGFGGEFAPLLVALLASGADGEAPYMMDMQVNMPAPVAKAQNETPEEVSAYMRRMVTLAARIESAGLPPRYMSAGLGQGPQDTVDLYFTRAPQFSLDDLREGGL